MEHETKKFLGSWDGASFHDADLVFSAHCNRVSVRDGHTQAVSLELRETPSVDEIMETMRAFRGRPQELCLPTAPEHAIVVRTERDLLKERLNAFMRKLFAAKSEVRGAEQKDLFFNEAEVLAPAAAPGEVALEDTVQVPAHPGVGHAGGGLGQPPLQGRLQHQGQEAQQHMAPDPFLRPVLAT